MDILEAFPAHSALRQPSDNRIPEETTLAAFWFISGMLAVPAVIVVTCEAAHGSTPCIDDSLVDVKIVINEEVS
jgi:hypothetical protein